MKTIHKLMLKQKKMKKYAEKMLAKENINGADKIFCYSLVNPIHTEAPAGGRPQVIESLFNIRKFEPGSIVSYQMMIYTVHDLFNNNYPINTMLNEPMENKENYEILAQLRLDLTNYFVLHEMHAFIYNY